MLVSARSVRDESIDEARREFPGTEFLRPDISDGPFSGTSRSWTDAEILFTDGWLPNPGQATALRWVQSSNAGVDDVVGHPLFAHGSVRLSSISGIHAIPIPEFVFMALLAWTNRLPALLEMQRAAAWPTLDDRPGLSKEELYGHTLGIVGYGSIGRQVARIAQAFGMRVLAMQRGEDHHDYGYLLPGTGDPNGTIPERYFAREQLHELLAASDVVLLALPSTPASRGLIDEAALRCMKPSAFLVNVARGAVVDEPVLIRALREGWIAGAALDVFVQEPLPPKSELWRLPNVIVTPHMSGATPHYWSRAFSLFMENMRRFQRGDSLYNEVDFARGY